MLDRLKFSIPISITIDAPIDVVWRVLTNVQSYPNILSSVEKAKPIEDSYSSHRKRSRDGGDGKGSQSKPSSTSQSNNSQSNQGHQLKGSKWKLTRISVLEKLRYTANITITQYNDEDVNKRSFTMSTNKMLGAACSLKIIVETVQKPTSEDDDSSDQNQTSLQAKDDDDDKNDTPTTSQCCQVTAIVSMIPLQFFVKLVGIMCGLRLLKYRARMAMEHDLDDLATYCEQLLATYSGTTNTTVVAAKKKKKKKKAKKLKGDVGSYYHEDFLREQIDLLDNMVYNNNNEKKEKSEGKGKDGEKDQDEDGDIKMCNNNPPPPPPPLSSPEEDESLAESSSDDDDIAPLPPPPPPQQQQHSDHVEEEKGEANDITETIDSFITDLFTSDLSSDIAAEVDDSRRIYIEICEFCASGDLSLAALRQKMSLVSTSDIRLAYEKYGCPFFHEICLNENVTLEIVQYLLKEFPLLSKLSTKLLCKDGNTISFPLHCACYNENCPNEVIKLLINENPGALEISCFVWDGVDVDSDYYIEGLPLHYYLTRQNVDIGTVKALVQAYPAALLHQPENEMHLAPIHVILSNQNTNNLHDVLAYLIDSEPSSVRMISSNQVTPLHLACKNKCITLETVHLLFNRWPEAIGLSDGTGLLPIHELCYNAEVDDIVSNDILRFMMMDPTLLRERSDNGYLPIHIAVSHKSFAFCKALIDAYPESVKVEGDHYLPIHEACQFGSRDDSIETIQYLLRLYPESLHVREELNGWLPIHVAARGGNKKAVELLLVHDPSAASKEATRGSCFLPLHLACFPGGHHDVDTVKALYDSYPEAILIPNRIGETPINLAQNTAIVDFLQIQLEYARKAQDITIMTTLDENGWLPLHHALKDNAPLGSIKLLSRGSALRAVDKKLAFPLHIACEFSSVKVVQYLVEKYDRSVDHCDDNNDSILHYACRGGNLGVVKYLLEGHAHLVASTTTANDKNKLPLHLLCESRRGGEDSESPDYIETIWLLLLAYPEALMT